MPPLIRPDQQAYHFHAYDFAGSAPWTPSPNQPARDNWQFYSMVQDLQGLRDLGRQKPIPVVQLDVSPGIDLLHRRIMTLSFGNPNAEAVFITGGIHAREWIAPEMAYLLAEYLILNYPAGDGKLTRHQTAIHDLVDNRWIQITPMLNPGGIQHTVFVQTEQARLWRKNRRRLPTDAKGWVKLLSTNGVANEPFKDVTVAKGRCKYDIPRYAGKNAVRSTPRPQRLPFGQIGVDLNRNYPTKAWGHEGYKLIPANWRLENREGDPKKDCYFGPGPGSEKETRYVVEYLKRTQKPETAVDYHSYGKFILYPSEVYDDQLPGEHEAVGKVINQLITAKLGGNPVYELGGPKDKMGYDAPGSLSDHLAQTYEARSFVIELAPHKSEVQGKPLGTGFKPDENVIQTVFEQNIRAALALIAAAGAKSEEDVDKLADEYGSWDVFGRGNQLPKSDDADA